MLVSGGCQAGRAAAAVRAPAAVQRRVVSYLGVSGDVGLGRHRAPPAPPSHRVAALRGPSPAPTLGGGSKIWAREGATTSFAKSLHSTETWR